MRAPDGWYRAAHIRVCQEHFQPPPSLARILEGLHKRPRRIAPTAMWLIAHRRCKSRVLRQCLAAGRRSISNLKSLLETGSAVLRDPYLIESADSNYFLDMLGQLPCNVGATCLSAPGCRIRPAYR